MSQLIISKSLTPLLLLILIACSPVAKNPTNLDFHTVKTGSPPEQEYKIQIGDQLDIKFFYHPELNEQIIIRPDGRISLQLAHDIMAASLTPAELGDLLTKKYATELKQPEVVVIVRSFSSQKVYVDGEVSKPGMIPLVGTATVLQSISQAGGMKDSARTAEVIIIRRGGDNKPLALTVNLDRAIDGTDMSQDIVLSPFDIVYVPKSPIADVNTWVDLYIRKNIPVSMGIGYYPP